MRRIETHVRALSIHLLRLPSTSLGLVLMSLHESDSKGLAVYSAMLDGDIFTMAPSQYSIHIKQFCQKIVPMVLLVN